MKHSLQLKLSQHLTLTPQLQQSIRLLQLSTLELNQELERYLAENPLLEREDLATGDDARPAVPAAARRARRRRRGRADESARGIGRACAERPRLRRRGRAHGRIRGRDDDERDDFTQFAASEPTLREHLLQQLIAHRAHRARQAPRRTR